MLCSEFDTRMQKLLDERQPPELDTALLGHAQQCPNCRDQLATLSRLLGSLELLEVPSLSSDFAHRVVDSVVGSTPRSVARPSRDSSLLVAAAIALSLLLAATLVGWQAIDGRRPLAQPGAEDNPRPGTQAPETPQRSLPNASGRGWMVSSAIFELYPEATRARHRQQVTEIADDLRPIATPFSAAVTAIRRSIPGVKPEMKGEPRASIGHGEHARHIS